MEAGPIIVWDKKTSKPLEIRFVLLLLLPFVTNLQNRTGSDLFSPDKIRHVQFRHLGNLRPQGAPMWPKATHGGRRPPAREASVPAPQGPRKVGARSAPCFLVNKKKKRIWILPEIQLSWQPHNLFLCLWLKNRWCPFLK